MTERNLDSKGSMGGGDRRGLLIVGPVAILFWIVLFIAVANLPSIIKLT